MYVPSEVFFVSGTGRHRTGVGSFERALRDAGVEPYNLVSVSSIFPPEADIVEPHEGVARLEAGQVVHAVIGRETKNDAHPRAAVGVARADEGHGYFVEGDGVTGDEAERLAREMVETSDATGDVARSFNVEASATTDGDGYVTAVAAAVLVPPQRINGASP
jgi:arginine decarboxylase